MEELKDIVLRRLDDFVYIWEPPVELLRLKSSAKDIKRNYKKILSECLPRFKIIHEIHKLVVSFRAVGYDYVSIYYLVRK